MNINKYFIIFIIEFVIRFSLSLLCRNQSQQESAELAKYKTAMPNMKARYLRCYELWFTAVQVVLHIDNVLTHIARTDYFT